MGIDSGNKDRVARVIQRQANFAHPVSDAEPPVMFHRTGIVRIALWVVGGVPVSVNQYAGHVSPRKIKCQIHTHRPSPYNQDGCNKQIFDSPYWFLFNKFYQTLGGYARWEI